MDTQLGREFAEHDLSGGQWQLVAIAGRWPARLCADPRRPVPISTPGQSTPSTQAIEEVAAGITTVIISHRFSTISMADRILVMDKGRIIEQGTQSADERRRTLCRAVALHEHYRIRTWGSLMPALTLSYEVLPFAPVSSARWINAMAGRIPVALV